MRDDMAVEQQMLELPSLHPRWNEAGVKARERGASCGEASDSVGSPREKVG
jgi:hypothetical protein